MRPLTKPLTLLLVLAMLLFTTTKSISQCNNWNISAHLTLAATCAANGGFNVKISGPDSVNLVNIQYGIPTAPNGFTVPLNNSSVFTGVPPGTYTISATATCGSSLVGKNTSITVPGSYIPPIMYASVNRGSPSCLSTGRITVSIVNGAPPFTVHIISAPSSYKGATSFTAYGSYLVDALPPGNFEVQVTDICGSGTTPVTLNVPSLSVSSLSFILPADYFYGSCDTVYAEQPYIPTSSNWYAYNNDTIVKITAQISGVMPSATPISPLSGNPFTIALPAGKSVKDCYGKTIVYTIYPPCNSPYTLTYTIPYPVTTLQPDQDCNKSFVTHVSFGSDICYPITYQFKSSSGTVYGPFTTNASYITSPVFNLGSYTFSYTTNDGYSETKSFAAYPITANPYTVTYVSYGSGLNGFIDYFQFSTTATSLINKTVELFTGPTGYSFLGTWSGGTYYTAQQNMTPGTSKLFFPAGNYVWKITDSCGSYLLPVTVPTSALYYYTAAVDHKARVCNGMRYWFKGSATKDGKTMPIYFHLLLNGSYYFESGLWRAYAPGDSATITAPGVYTIITSSSPSISLLPVPYPNVYTVTDTFVYTGAPVQVDVYNSQGFICKSGLPGSAKIYANGMKGIPFHTPSLHYNFDLARHGLGEYGPFISSNTTGIFTGFGGNANDTFDVRISDSCGAFSVQPLRILDLGIARLISSNHYVACAGDSVRLSGIYLPDATYYWTGPDGFTSTQRSPLLTNVSAANTGVYHLTVYTTSCSQTSTDSAVLIMSANPPKPDVSLNCDSPVTLRITNHTAGFVYQWVDYVNLYNDTFSIYYSNADTQQVNLFGSYKVVAIDTTTGCSTSSDSIYFAAPPAEVWKASIYSPHLRVCTGDTTILVANGPAYAFSGAATYQWFKNGVPIPGATDVSYTTSIAGNYKVSINTGPCTTDTSAEVTVTNVPIPSAAITASAHDVCQGDTVALHANLSSGYIYTWHYNDTTVPFIYGPDLYVTQPGNYYVTVSNNGCARSSDRDTVITHARPVVPITPATTQVLCPGHAIYFSTTSDTSFTYTWLRNDTDQRGTNGNTFATVTSGSFRVRVSTRYCPAVLSDSVAVTAAADAITLGNDTVICKAGPFAILYSVDTSFKTVRWSDGETTTHITVTSPGSYWVQATDACGSFTDTVHITTPAYYSPGLPADTFICNENNTAILSVPSALQHIRWSTGDTMPSVAITHTGVYWVQGSFICGTLYDTVMVHFCTPAINSVSTTDTICAGTCIHFSADISNYPQQYSWTFPGASPDSFNGPAPPDVCYNTPGIFIATLQVVNAGGTAMATIPITVLPQPVGRFADTALQIPYDTLVLLPACTDALRTRWYKGDSLICDDCPVLHLQAKYWSAGYYCVVSNGDCSDTCTYTVHATDIPSDIWLPSAFSPNGDGLNDYFHIVTDNPNIIVMELSVYNRWGQRVFVAMRSNKGWDGTQSGVPVEVGTYFYYLRYTVTGSDEVHSMKGDLTLIR